MINENMFWVSVSESNNWKACWEAINKNWNRKKGKFMCDLDEDETKAIKKHIESQLDDIYFNLDYNNNKIIEFALENNEYKSKISAFKKILKDLEEECSDCEDCEKS